MVYLACSIKCVKIGAASTASVRHRPKLCRSGVPLHAQDWQRCVRYCLNDAIGGYLYRLQIPPQMAEGLVMVAGHGGAAAYKPRQSPRGQGPMYQVALGLLMIRDPIQQVAAEIDVQCLHPPADAQNWAFPLHKGLYQPFSSRQAFPRYHRRREQQSAHRAESALSVLQMGMPPAKYTAAGVIAPDRPVGRE